jgi:hypothetical protein
MRRRTEPLSPLCWQGAVIGGQVAAKLFRSLSASDPDGPLITGVNGTLMARRSLEAGSGHPCVGGPVTRRIRRSLRWSGILRC